MSKETKDGGRLDDDMTAENEKCTSSDNDKRQQPKNDIDSRSRRGATTDRNSVTNRKSSSYAINDLITKLDDNNICKKKPVNNQLENRKPNSGLRKTETSLDTDSKHVPKSARKVSSDDQISAGTSKINFPTHPPFLFPPLTVPFFGPMPAACPLIGQELQHPGFLWSPLPVAWSLAPYLPFKAPGIPGPLTSFVPPIVVNKEPMAADVIQQSPSNADVSMTVPSMNMNVELVNGGYGIKNPLAKNQVPDLPTSGSTCSNFTPSAPVSSYDCRICHKKFKLPRLLNRHLKTCHSPTKRFICIFCRKGFNDKFDLKRHTRTHTGVKPFKCDFSRCDKAFTQRCSLESHMKKVHSVQHSYRHKERRSKVYVCEECGFTNEQMEPYVEHLKMVHPFSVVLFKNEKKNVKSPPFAVH